MSAWVRAAAGILAGGIVGCTAGPPPVSAWLLGVAGSGGPGTVEGRVFTWREAAFLPLPGAAIAVDGAPAMTAADADGRFRCAGLVGDAHRLAATGPGLAGVVVEVRPGAGLVGVVLLAIEAADERARGDRQILGVVTDPWGAALPGGTVHCVDSVSAGGAGGNRRWQASPEGLFAGRLPDAPAGGIASFMGYGRLADGRAAEGLTLQTVALGAGMTIGVVVATHLAAGGEGAVKSISRGAQALERAESRAL